MKLPSPSQIRGSQQNSESNNLQNEAPVWGILDKKRPPAPPLSFSQPNEEPSQHRRASGQVPPHTHTHLGQG
ncbi:hypothetical protein GN956_G19870 [Arapaima gigas]